MKSGRPRTMVWMGIAACTLAFAQAARAAETTLSVVSSFPKTSVIVAPLFHYIEEVNRKGKGIVQIRYVGGPEVTPVPEQLGAVQRGIVQAYYGSISFFQSEIDESRALVLTDYRATELRKSGALDLLAQYFEKKPKLHYLSYFGSGYTFYIYATKEPKRRPDGGVDLSGFRVRGPSIYHPLYEEVNATPVNVQVPEMFQALQRGTIDGIGWLDIGLSDFGWQKFLKYRIVPNYWRGDVSIVVQLAAWNALSSEAKKLLTELAHKHEGLAHDFLSSKSDDELKKLRAAGMKDVALTGKGREAYLRAANEALWDLIEKKSGKQTRVELERAFTKKGK